MAAVCTAMTVGVPDKVEGYLLRVVDAQKNAAKDGDELPPARVDDVLPTLTIRSLDALSDSL